MQNCTVRLVFYRLATCSRDLFPTCSALKDKKTGTGQENPPFGNPPASMFRRVLAQGYKSKLFLRAGR